MGISEQENVSLSQYDVERWIIRNAKTLAKHLIRHDKEGFPLCGDLLIGIHENKVQFVVVERHTNSET